MPEIPLFDEDGERISQLQTWLTVHGVMWLPNDLDSVLNYRTLAAPEQPVLSNLFKKTTLRLSKNKTGGTIVAHVFVLLLQLKIHRPNDASVNKAAFLVSRLMEKLPPISEKRKAPADEDNVHKFWNKYRRAAHLWGAAKWLDELGLEPRTDDEVASYPPKILIVSDHLLRMATEVGWQFHPDPWVLPKAYPGRSLDFSLPPPKPDVIELLKDFGSSNRTK